MAGGAMEFREIKVIDSFAEIVASLAYIPAGLVFGYLYLLPAGNFESSINYNNTKLWPFVVALLSVIISAAVINGLKLNFRKYKFVHFYIHLTAMMLFFACGFIFIFSDELTPAIYLSSIGYGLVLVPGLSYITVRARKKWRSFFLSLCYFWFLTGVAVTATLHYYLEGFYKKEFGIVLAATSAIVVFLIAINEILQNNNVNGYDYKMPQDYDVVTAHDNGKLMFRSEAPNLYTTFSNSSGEIPFKTTNYHGYWIAFMVATKLKGFITFYWIILLNGVGYVTYLLDAGYPIFWFMVLGCLIGTLLSLFLNNKTTFIISSMLHIMSLILCTIFFYHPVKNSDATELGVCHILFFIFVSVSIAVPDINILELSPVNFNEAMLAIGFIIEILSIALLQYFGVTDPGIWGFDPSGTPKENLIDIISAHYISMIVLSAILVTIVLLHMPNTFGKSLVEINAMMKKLNSYTVFQTDSILVKNEIIFENNTVFETVSKEEIEKKEKKKRKSPEKPVVEEIEQSAFDYGSIRAQPMVPRAYLSDSPLNRNYY